MVEQTSVIPAHKKSRKKDPVVQGQPDTLSKTKHTTEIFGLSRELALTTDAAMLRFLSILRNIIRVHNARGGITPWLVCFQFLPYVKFANLYFPRI